MKYTTTNTYVKKSPKHFSIFLFRGLSLHTIHLEQARVVDRAACSGQRIGRDGGTGMKETIVKNNHTIVSRRVYPELVEGLDLPTSRLAAYAMPHAFMIIVSML